MARVYAIEEHTGRRILIRIGCNGCDAALKPGPDVVNNGWTKVGQDSGIGTDKLEWTWCPVCSR